MSQSVCPAVASTGQRCQLPEHHNSPHEWSDEHGKMTWEPRYVGEMRGELGLLRERLSFYEEEARTRA
jgi:hypothetical protein